jgi:hypothetical protein
VAFEDLEQLDTAPAGRRRARRLLSWTAVIMLGLLVYEFTTSPALGAAMLSLKFGWPDFRTALWLRRTDPNGDRSRACFWLYAAAGLWKVALASFVIFWAVAVVSTWVQGPKLGQQWRTLFLALIVTGFGLALVSCGLATLASYAALARARLTGVRLWLHEEMHQAPRENAWPPLYGRGNRAGRLFAFSAATVYFVGLVLLGLGLNALERAGAPVGRLTPLLALLWLIFFGPVLMRWTMAHGRRATAGRPEDCWGTDPLPGPDVYDSYISDAGAAD